jgi:hypothetical protein
VPSYAAVLAYGQALDLADQGKREEAQKAFQQVVSLAPSLKRVETFLTPK